MPGAVSSHARPWRGPAGEQGVAAVELAVVVLPLLLILLGVVEFGRVYSQQLSMQYAAREAARTIALEYDDPGMTAALLDGEVESALLNMLPISDLSELYSYNIELCSTSVTDPQDAVVELEDRLDLAIPLPDDAFTDVPVRARAQMPCEG